MKTSRNVTRSVVDLSIYFAFLSPILGVLLGFLSLLLFAR